jgi:G1/S-specific cyclin PLC1
MPCTRHRLFLATLIVASKYLNDSSPKNKHWSLFAVLFELYEVNLMEKQLLLLLEYDLRFDEQEACELFAPFMDAKASTSRRRQQLELDASMRAAAIDRVSRAGRARAKAQMQEAPTSSPSQDPARPADSASAVRGIAKGLSTTHLSAPSQPQQADTPRAYTPSPMGSCASSDASGSEIGSLLEDSGLSSASSDFTSEDEADDNDDEARREPSKKLAIQPPHYYAYCRSQKRARKPSDTSSVKSTVTVTGKAGVDSPTHKDNYVGSRRPPPSKRVISMAYGSHPREETGHSQAERLTPSVTMPSLAFGRSGASSGSFLSRMWGAAKGQADKDRVPEPSHSGENLKPVQGQTTALDIGDLAEGRGRGTSSSSTLRRLVLAHSRSGVFRGGGNT